MRYWLLRALMETMARRGALPNTQKNRPIDWKPFLRGHRERREDIEGWLTGARLKEK